jgi:hypothetical protein
MSACVSRYCLGADCWGCAIPVMQQLKGAITRPRVRSCWAASRVAHWPLPWVSSKPVPQRLRLVHVGPNVASALHLFTDHRPELERGERVVQFVVIP